MVGSYDGSTVDVEAALSSSHEIDSEHEYSIGLDKQIYKYFLTHQL